MKSKTKINSNSKKSKNSSSRLNPAYRIISAEEPTSYAAEAYRRIKVGLDAMSSEKEHRVIQICSAMPGDGKTTTLLNLAIAYAESGSRVLLLDLDLRKPKMHRSFKIENKNGISEYLIGKVENLVDIINHTKYDNVSFVCAGQSSFRPSTLLSLDKLGSAIETFRKYFDIILVDNPPILATSDSCIVSKHCDGAIFQISRRNTDRNASREAVKVLSQNGVNILGVVFTQVEAEGRSYYGKKYKYYRYY